MNKFLIILVLMFLLYVSVQLVFLLVEILLIMSVSQFGVLMNIIYLEVEICQVVLLVKYLSNYSGVIIEQLNNNIVVVGLVYQLMFIGVV